jgi:predicted enzyme related to lactoylglutathione lyase
VLTPLNRIIIFVGDVEKCGNFYRDVFGFTALPGGDADWIELETGGCRLALHKAHGSKGRMNSPTGNSKNPHKIVFFAQDVEATRAAIVKRGAKMGKIHSYGSLTFCDGKDPEGHVFQISNRP